MNFQLFSNLIQKPYFDLLCHLADLRSMVSVGLATIASCNFDIVSALQGKKPMHILCIGHGGGSLPLFLASKIQGEILGLSWFMLVCSISILASLFS